MVKFKSSSASFVKEVGSLSLDLYKSNLIKYCQDTIQGIENTFEKKIDRSLLRYICNIVENTLDKKHIVDKKLNKKELVLEIYLTFKTHANNGDDKRILGELIEDLHNTGEIKKVSLKRYVSKNVKSILKKAVSWF